MAESRTHTPIPIPRQFCLLVPPVSVSWEPFLTPHQPAAAAAVRSIQIPLSCHHDGRHHHRCKFHPSNALLAGARSRIATRRAGGPPRLTYSEHRMCRIINSLIHLSSCRSVAARSRRNSSTLTNPARPRRAKANSCTLWSWVGVGVRTSNGGAGGNTCLLPLVCLSTTGMVECGGSFPTRALHRRRYGPPNVEVSYCALLEVFVPTVSSPCGKHELMGVCLLYIETDGLCHVGCK